MRIEYKTPSWVTAYPTAHWKGHDGWKQLIGWPGVEHFLREYDRTAAVPAPSSAPPSQPGETPARGFQMGVYPWRGNWTTVNGEYLGKSGMIEHLMNDGIHSGKFPRAWLESLSREQLHQLHYDDHGGFPEKTKGRKRRK